MNAVMNDDALEQAADHSPLARYREHLERDELAFQVSADGTPVFFPRVIAPGTGAVDLAWRTSAGLGTVYATTAVHARGEPPYNVALIDMDEGFRLMSRVEGIDAAVVRIGLRVKARVHRESDAPPYPVFDALATGPAA